MPRHQKSKLERNYGAAAVTIVGLAAILTTGAWRWTLAAVWIMLLAGLLIRRSHA